MENIIRKIVRKIIKESFDGYEIRKFRAEDKSQVMELMVNTFSHVMKAENIPPYTDSITNYNESIVVDKVGEIIGFYLLGDRQLPKGIEDEEIDKAGKVYVNLHDYENKRGVEGVALVIEKEYRSLGIASKLKDYPKTLGVDYIWGIAFKELNNLGQWLRRRKLAAEGAGINITVEDFKKDIVNEGYKPGSYLYHGTTDLFWNDILKHGLKNPYLTDSEEKAYKYSLGAAEDNGGNPITINVLIPDVSKLRVDFNELDEPVISDDMGEKDEVLDKIKRYYNKYVKEHPERYIKKHNIVGINPKDYYFSLETVHAVMYDGTIPVGSFWSKDML